jgi:hypothetical protein
VTNAERVQIYSRPAGTRRLTPRQRRRMIHKANRAAKRGRWS